MGAAARGLDARSVATSGIAAILLELGRTFHSRCRASLKPEPPAPDASEYMETGDHFSQTGTTSTDDDDSDFEPDFEMPPQNISQQRQPASASPTFHCIMPLCDWTGACYIRSLASQWETRYRRV